MKKFLISTLFISSFAGYVLYSSISSPVQAGAIPSEMESIHTEVLAISDDTSVAPPSTSVPIGPETTTTTPKSTAPSPVSVPAVTPVPATAPRGQYKNGTYVGKTIDSYYGQLQVAAVISGGKLTDVTFLQYPSDRSTSRSINERAMSRLKSEAIQAQSANIDGVSGASDSTSAFKKSLSSALVLAKN